MNSRYDPHPQPGWSADCIPRNGTDSARRTLRTTRTLALPVDSAIYALTFAFTVLRSSMFYTYLGADLAAWAGRGLLIISLVGLMRAILTGGVTVTLFSVAWFGFFVAEFKSFAFQQHTSVDVTVLYTVLGVLAAPIVYRMLASGQGRPLSRITLAIAIGYGVAYPVMAHLHKSDVMATANGTSMTTGARMFRIVMDNATISMGYFMSLALLRARRWFFIVPLAIFILDMVMAQSRFYTLIIMLTTTTYLVSRSVRITSFACLSIFAVVGIGMLGCLFLDINPFSHFGTDLSGEARRVSFEFARNGILHQPIFGAGLPSGSDANTVGTWAGFNWNDLGLIGIAFATGVSGVVIFVATSALVCSSRRNLTLAGFDDVAAEGLTLAGAATTLYGVIAPTLWYNAMLLASIYAAAFILRMHKTRLRHVAARYSTAQAKLR